MTTPETGRVEEWRKQQDGEHGDGWAFLCFRIEGRELFYYMPEPAVDAILAARTQAAAAEALAEALGGVIDQMPLGFGEFHLHDCYRRKWLDQLIGTFFNEQKLPLEEASRRATEDCDLNHFTCSPSCQRAKEALLAYRTALERKETDRE